MYRSVRWRHHGGDLIEVQEYHDGRYGAPGEPRQKKKKATPQDMERMNRWNRERLCWRKLVNHFAVHDYFVTLTYRREERPADMEAAKKDFAVFINKLRRRYKKAGVQLVWIRNIEVGTRGGWHVHLVLRRIQDLDIHIAECWPYGRAVLQLLYQRGNMKQLAAYLTKSPATDPRLKESHYWTSRNLPVPDPEKKGIRGWKLSDAVRVPAGYYLDKDSYFEGVNLFGYAFRTYILVRIRPGKKRGG